MSAFSTTKQTQNGFFHSLSKVATTGTQAPYESIYKSAHSVFADDVFTDVVPYAATAISADLNVASNPTILKKYTQFTLTPVAGSNNQAYSIIDTGKYIHPIILPTDILDASGNPAYGYAANIYQQSGTLIPPTAGSWVVDGYSGLVLFNPGYTPVDMSWGNITITCYCYVGKKLSDAPVSTSWLVPSLSYSVTDPSTLTPTSGQQYIVAPSAIGVWSGKDNNIATYNGASWTFALPVQGGVTYVLDVNTIYTTNGITWKQIGAVQEAPLDGKVYGRQNATWIQNPNGGVFITNVVPNGGGNVGTKVYAADGVQLLSCVSSTNLITVSVLAITGYTHYTPVVTVNGNPVTLSASGDKPVFTGNVNINLGAGTTITIAHEDGATNVCTVGVDAAPTVLTATFTGGYPGTQTELKAGDTYLFNVVSDIPITAVELQTYHAFNGQVFPVVSGTNHTVVGTISNQGTVVQSLGAQVRVQKSTGTWSAWHNTELDGAVNGVNVVNLNNLFPTVSCGLITYPGGQSALKNVETATVVNTVTNYDVVSYTSPNGDLTVTSLAIAQTPKTVTRLAGSYNIVTPNFHITATRNANNATSSAQTLVQIANVATVVTVSTPQARLRSGGNDGTAAQNYLITMTCDQNLSQAPTLVEGTAGTWQGAGFAGANTTWTRSIQITDAMAKGTFAWGALAAQNLSGLVTTTITTGPNYTCGGFVPRSITLAAYANTAIMNVAAETYAKVTIGWTVKSLTIQKPVGTTTPPAVVNAWSLDALNTNPTTIRIEDIPAANGSSSPSQLTLEELV